MITSCTIIRTCLGIYVLSSDVNKLEKEHDKNYCNSHNEREGYTRVVTARAEQIPNT